MLISIRYFLHAAKQPCLFTPSVLLYVISAIISAQDLYFLFSFASPSALTRSSGCEGQSRTRNTVINYLGKRIYSHYQKLQYLSQQYRCQQLLQIMCVEGGEPLVGYGEGVRGHEILHNKYIVIAGYYQIQNSNNIRTALKSIQLNKNGSK